jgi:hypothetical protein
MSILFQSRDGDFPRRFIAEANPGSGAFTISASDGYLKPFAWAGSFPTMAPAATPMENLT